MKTNELADELDTLKSEYLIWEWATKAQAMLRKIGSNCACGEPSSLNTVHRKDSPCYVKEELTNEEIENIYWSLDSTGYDGCFDFIEFARAILRKAQEK